MNYRYLIFVLTLFISINLCAQRKATKHNIDNATGYAIGGESATPEQVKQKAINQAKINALKKAGIEENINSYSNLFRSETNDKMEELFTSDILSNINGTVKNVEIIDAKLGVTNEGQIKYDVIIKCTVVKYKTKNDASFDAWIDGVKKVYKGGEGLSFTIKPTQNCYVRAFMFTEESFILLPNDYEQSKLLNAHSNHIFPNPNLVEAYQLEIKPGLDKELNRLVIVLLKEDIYYTGKINYKDITDWIMSIPPDEREIKSFAFDVYKNE